MAKHNRIKGGARKGEPKEIQFWDCAICTKTGLTKRGTKLVGWFKGRKIRACRHHPTPPRPSVFVYDREEARKEQAAIRTLS